MKESIERLMTLFLSPVLGAKEKSHGKVLLDIVFVRKTFVWNCETETRCYVGVFAMAEGPTLQWLLAGCTPGFLLFFSFRNLVQTYFNTEPITSKEMLKFKFQPTSMRFEMCATMDNITDNIMDNIKRKIKIYQLVYIYIIFKA